MTGDGAPDILNPLTLTVEYTGEMAACRAQLAQWYSPTIARGVTAAAGRFQTEVHRLQGFSISGMQGKSGVPWQQLTDSLFRKMGFPEISTATVSLDGLVSFSGAAYTDELENETVTHSDESSGDTQVERDEWGGVRVRSNTTTRSRETRTGTPKRSNRKVDDIVDSQLRFAITIPHGGKNLRIGSTVRVVYAASIPEAVRRVADSGIDGKVLTGRVINVDGLTYEKSDDTYRLLPGQVKLAIAPEGEDDILKHVNLELIASDGSYTVQVVD